MHSDRKWTRNLVGSGRFYLCIVLFFIGVSAVVFAWGDDIILFDSSSSADASRLASYGDFCAGVLGSLVALFSILLVLKTLSLQRETSENQRFNDLFFELLHLYKTLVDDFKSEKDNSPFYDTSMMASWGSESVTVNDTHKGKSFFECEKSKLQQRFYPKGDYIKDNSQAIRDFVEVYHRYEEYLSVYFRTLYRIFDLIDRSPISDEEKKKYAKILRAQLSRGELFFLRYNAFTPQGRNFRMYLYKYNVLKHLPYFELLEFTRWRKDMAQSRDIDEINSQLIRFVKEFNRWYDNVRHRVKLYAFGSRYRFRLSYLSNRDIEIGLRRNNSEPDQTYMKFLDRLSREELRQFITAFAYETFIMSNFRLVNGGTTIVSDCKCDIPDIDTVSCKVTNKSNPLEVRYRFNKKKRKRWKNL